MCIFLHFFSSFCVNFVHVCVFCSLCCCILQWETVLWWDWRTVWRVSSPWLCVYSEMVSHERCVELRNNPNLCCADVSCVFQVRRKIKMKLQMRLWSWWERTSDRWLPSGKLFLWKDCRRRAPERSLAPLSPTWSTANPTRCNATFIVFMSQQFSQTVELNTAGVNCWREPFFFF